MLNLVGQVMGWYRTGAVHPSFITCILLMRTADLIAVSRLSNAVFARELMSQKVREPFCQNPTLS